MKKKFLKARKRAKGAVSEREVRAKMRGLKGKRRLPRPPDEPEEAGMMS